MKKEHYLDIVDFFYADNRFEIIKKAKKDLLESTNIHTSEDEMKVLDNFLFRCWQMDWLKMYEDNKPLYLNQLEKGKPYWDNKEKQWCLYVDYKVFLYEDGYSSIFEINRFYKKEVKEND